MKSLNYLKSKPSTFTSKLNRECQILMDLEYLKQLNTKFMTDRELETLARRTLKLETYLESIRAEIEEDLSAYSSVDFAMTLVEAASLKKNVLEIQSRWMPMLREREMLAYNKYHSAIMFRANT